MEGTFLLPNGLIFSLCVAGTNLSCPFLVLASFVFLAQSVREPLAAL